MVQIRREDPLPTQPPKGGAGLPANSCVCSSVNSISAVVRFTAGRAGSGPPPLPYGNTCGGLVAQMPFRKVSTLSLTGLFLFVST